MANLSSFQIFVIFLGGFTLGYFIRSIILLVISLKQLKKIKSEEEKIDERIKDVKEKIKKHAENIEERLGME